MRVHLDVLGWLYILCGVFGVLTGMSLGVLASGTSAALADLGGTSASASPTVWFLTLCSATLVLGGILMMAAGRFVVRRNPVGRAAALVLAVPNLVVIPFGTALGVYTFWALLNDDARREFGRPTRTPLPGSARSH